MTAQLSESYLILSMGFKVVARYNRFDKIYNGMWDVYKAVCLQKDNHCIIKIYHSGRSFTLEYNSKESANNKIKDLLNMGYRRVEK